MIFDIFHSSALFSGVTKPVKTAISDSGMSVNLRNVAMCCSTRGLVGARNRIFDLGKLLSLWTASIKAMLVLPIPVGSTTRVLPIVQVSRIVS